MLLKRKLTWVLCIGVLVVSACGGSGSTSGQSDTDSGSQTTFTLPHLSTTTVAQLPTTTLPPVLDQPVYVPVCSRGQAALADDLSCIPVAETAGMYYITETAGCSVVGDMEGQFTTSAQMLDYAQCVLPGLLQWVNSVYANMSMPNNIYFVPNTVSGYVGNIQGLCPHDGAQLAYCLLDGNVYLGEAAMWMLYSQHGDAAPALVMAHELGHRFQHVAGMPIRTTQAESIADENQSDCIAGVFMAYAASQGWLDLEDDIVDLATALQAAGSAEGPSRSHGTAMERLQSFDAGYLSTTGMSACNSFVSDVPIITN